MNVSQVLVGYRAIHNVLHQEQGGLESSETPPGIDHTTDSLRAVLAAANVPGAGPAALGTLSDALSPNP
jgi:hypothetical protein